MFHLIYGAFLPCKVDSNCFEGDYAEFKVYEGIHSGADEFPATSIGPLPEGVKDDERVGTETVERENRNPSGETRKLTMGLAVRWALNFWQECYRKAVSILDRAFCQ